MALWFSLLKSAASQLTVHSDTWSGPRVVWSVPGAWEAEVWHVAPRPYLCGAQKGPLWGRQAWGTGGWREVVAFTSPSLLCVLAHVAVGLRCTFSPMLEGAGWGPGYRLLS